jgi:hypothetical protein
MAGKRYPLVLIPRFCTYVGSGAFPSLGIDVTAFEKAHVHVWRGAMRGTDSPGLAVKFEESSNRIDWDACGGGAETSIAEDDETSFELTLARQNLRVVAALSGTGPAVTLYAVGHLEQRMMGGTHVALPNS